MASPTDTWPRLPFDGWIDTYATLHMWTQVVGKVCLACTPLVNHFWNMTFQVTPRGLTTPSMTASGISFRISFDFIAHRLEILCSDGRSETIPLEPRTVADFYALVVGALQRLGLAVRIWPMPVEVPNPVRFDADTVHGAYDPDAANRVWRILLATAPVFERFRSRFIGKCSPVHFFWGSFDLAVTRFSGERAPERPGADRMTREAYSHAVISHGFWPGGAPVPEATFYAYAAPEPAGFADAAVSPDAAYYHGELKEYLLPYDAVRTDPSPEATLTEFLESSYNAGADLARWNRAELERS